MKLLKKKDNVYMSKLLVKFVNNLIFFNFKNKIEKWIYFSFFYWKKQLNVGSIYFFFEAIFKLRPLIGFYIYITETKQTKKIKIRPYFMGFDARWKKSLYWLTKSIKMEREKNSLYLNFVNELFMINFFEKSISLQQKIRYYKTILSFKTSKNYTW